MVQIIDIAREWQEKANAIHEKQQTLDKRIGVLDEQLETLRNAGGVRKLFNASVRIPKVEREREKALDMKRVHIEHLQSLSDEAYTLIGKTLAEQNPDLAGKGGRKSDKKTPEKAPEEDPEILKQKNAEKSLSLDTLDAEMDEMLSTIQSTRSVIAKALRQERNDYLTSSPTLTAMSWSSTNSAVRATSHCADRLKEFNKLYKEEQERCSHLGIELDGIAPDLDDLMTSSSFDFIVGLGDADSAGAAISSLANLRALQNVDGRLEEVSKKLQEGRADIMAHMQDMNRGTSRFNMDSDGRGPNGAPAIDKDDNPDVYAGLVEKMAAQHRNFGSFINKLKRHMSPEGRANIGPTPPASNHNHAH